MTTKFIRLLRVDGRGFPYLMLNDSLFYIGDKKGYFEQQIKAILVCRLSTLYAFYV